MGSAKRASNVRAEMRGCCLLLEEEEEEEEVAFGLGPTREGEAQASGKNSSAKAGLEARADGDEPEELVWVRSGGQTAVARVDWEPVRRLWMSPGRRWL